MTNYISSQFLLFIWLCFFSLGNTTLKHSVPFSTQEISYAQLREIFNINKKVIDGIEQHTTDFCLVLFLCENHFWTFCLEQEEMTLLFGFDD